MVRNLLFYFFLFGMDLINAFVRRDFLKAIVLKVENDIINVCYNCNFCKRCEKFHSLKNDFKKKGFNGFNKKVSFGMFIKITFVLNEYH